VLGAFDWQLVDSIVMNHLWYAVKRLTELTKDIMAYDPTVPYALGAHNLHVHEPPSASATLHHITAQLSKFAIIIQQYHIQNNDKLF
jgi:hypothetical protein